LTDLQTFEFSSKNFNGKSLILKVNFLENKNNKKGNFGSEYYDMIDPTNNGVDNMNRCYYSNISKYGSKNNSGRNSYFKSFIKLKELI
jgi:hypothetical protein